MKLSWSLVTGLFATCLTMPALADEDAVRKNTTTAAATVVWTAGPRNAPQPIAVAPLDAYAEAIESERTLSPRSREVAAVAGTIGAGALGTMGAVVFEHKPAMGVSLFGLSASMLGVGVGAILSPTLRGLREELAAAERDHDDDESTARAVDAAFARAAARERTVRKVTSALTVAGAATAIGSGVVLVATDDKAGASLSSFLLLGSAFAVIGVRDFLVPWEIEQRYTKARLKVDAHLSAAPLPGGGVVQLTGTF